MSGHPHPLLGSDLHTHTDFSDGHDPLDRVVAAAEAAGLRTLVVTDHVRADTSYLPEYVAAVRAARNHTRVRLVCGVEAKIMDTEGRIDLPDDLTGIDHIAIADHRFPLPEGPAHPGEVRERIEAGTLTPAEALDHLLTATTRAVARVPAGRTAHLAHLFSVLPKAGLDESALEGSALNERALDGSALNERAPDGSALDATHLAPLARACRQHNVAVELNEKWRCPTPRTAALLARAGVRLAAGSDAHHADAVGVFPWVAQALTETEGRCTT
ncbi:PHP domain-containing protein [Streptomyces sp. NPDC102364]|uniref:PHP domain-containing protein n=1 Tax=Streptomyces sp. NPDC102364 TaxID=3366161 RepID=UPI00381220A3